LLYDEVLSLIQSIASDFDEIIELESIGKTYENRDIWMMKIDGSKFDTNKDHEPKAILLTGAHHSRELVSVQMPLFTVLKMLHGALHQD